MLEFKGRAVVYFGADWCPACRKLKPVFEDARMEVAEIKFCMVNTDEEKELLRSHDVQGIPKMFVYEDGEIVKEGGYWRGVDELVSWLEQ